MAQWRECVSLVGSSCASPCLVCVSLWWVARLWHRVLRGSLWRVSCVCVSGGCLVLSLVGQRGPGGKGPACLAHPCCYRVCVCVCARARVYVCVCVCVPATAAWVRVSRAAVRHYLVRCAQIRSPLPLPSQSDWMRSNCVPVPAAAAPSGSIWSNDVHHHPLQPPFPSQQALIHTHTHTHTHTHKGASVAPSDFLSRCGQNTMRSKYDARPPGSFNAHPQLMGARAHTHEHAHAHARLSEWRGLDPLWSNTGSARSNSFDRRSRFDRRTHTGYSFDRRTRTGSVWSNGPRPWALSHKLENPKP